MSILTGGALLAPSSSAAPGGNATGHCAPAGDNVTKVENPGDEYTFTAPDGEVVTSVFIKAGKECIELSADGTDGCYAVSGIGTPEVTVERPGSGNQCKEISHIEFVTGAEPEEPTTTTAPTTTTTAPTTTTTTEGKPTTTTTAKTE